MFKLKKALYGFKQAPRAWYAHLTGFLLGFGFIRRQVDRTLFIKNVEYDLVIAQIYVDDNIFGATNFVFTFPRPSDQANKGRSV